VLQAPLQVPMFQVSRSPMHTGIVLVVVLMASVMLLSDSVLHPP
jgi:hypothetical protein